MKMKQTMCGKFEMGRVVATAGAIEALDPADMATALNRHVLGDWGDLCAADREENELGLREGFRLMSTYRDRNGTRFWVITEADRSATTVLLPDEY